MESCILEAFPCPPLSLVRWKFALLLLVCATVALYGQSTNAHLSGVVTDSSGAAITGAEVTATNADTGVPYTSTTNSAGVYVLSEVVPGAYQITVSKSGFGDIVRSGLKLSTGDSISQNFTMQPGAVQQSVSVTAADTLLSADTASTSDVLDNKMITELPQLNRDVLDLTATVPSVQGAGPLSDNIVSLGSTGYLIANHGNSYSLSGGQVNGTSISVDGNQVQDSEFNSSNRSIPTPDSVGEFRWKPEPLPRTGAGTRAESLPFRRRVARMFITVACSSIFATNC